MRTLLFIVPLCTTLVMCKGRSTALVVEPAEVAPPPAKADVVQVATVQEITPAQLAALLEKPAVFIYDCNEADMYTEAHVPHAELTVYDAITADKLPADHNAALVFYCYSAECPAGATAARTALTMGYHTVYCMTAGITGWQDAGMKTEP